MIEYNPIYKKNGSLNGAITTAPSNSLIFDLAGKAIWAKGVKLKGTDHTYTFSHDNYITLTNTPGSDESEDIKIGVNITTLKAAIDTTYSVVTASSDGLAPMFSSGNLADTDNTDHYYLGIKGSTLKWYKNAYRQLKVGDNIVLGVTDRDPLQIVSADSNLSVSWNSTNKLLVIKNEKPAIGDLTDINVSQFKVTDNTNYRLLFKGTANDNNYTGVSRFSEYLLFNPSTKLLTINGNRVITAVDVYVGATSEANATVGLVPAATSAQRTYFLRGDGTWQTLVQENTWRPIKVGTTDALGSGTDTGTLTFAAGTGITLGWDATNKKITITNSAPDQDHNTDRTGIKLGTVSGTKVTNSTLIIANSGTGLSIAGGTNLIKIGDGTNYIEVPITINHGLSTKNITINGATYALYTSANSLPTFIAPGSYGTANYILATNSSGDGLTWVAKPTSNVTTTAIVGNSATATSQITSAQTNPYYNLLEGGLVTRSIRFVAGTGITISAATDGLITITNTSPDLDHNTDRTGIYKGTVSGTKKTDTTLIIANTSSGLIFEGGTNLFKIGDGTNYVEIPVNPSFTVTDKSASILSSLTTLATIAGTDIKAKVVVDNKAATLTTTAQTIATVAGVDITAKITNYNTDENVKQTPKTDNVNRPLMMINGGTSAGELTTTSMFSTSIYANASTKMITANGFIKTGSDKDHVLLGDGSHDKFLLPLNTSPASTIATNIGSWTPISGRYVYRQNWTDSSTGGDTADFCIYLDGNLTANICLDGYFNTLCGYRVIGKDNTEVLLAGGGTKLISDFATSGHNHDGSYVTAVGAGSGDHANELYYTKNGNNTYFTVPYATISGYTNRFRSHGTSNWDANDLTYPVAENYGQPGGSSNYPGGYGSVFQILANGGSSLGGQFFWSINHNSTSSTKDLYFRAGNNLGWQNDWKRIAWASEIPTVNNASLTLQTAGTTQTIFYANDDTNRTFNVTCANIGAATSDHTHSSITDWVRETRLSKNSSNSEIESVTGWRTNGFIEILKFAPPALYFTTYDRPAPYGIGFGNGSESGGIMPIGAGDYLQEIRFYGANSGPTIFTFGRQVWDSTTYDSRYTNHYATYLSINSTNGNLSTSGTLTSTIATGTAPINVSSTTVCGNLNADLLDGNHASAFALAGHTHNYLSTVASINGSTHAEALKTLFTNNKANIPRNVLINYYSSAYGNGSQYFGYFLSGYDSNPYGGFYVCHYDTPYYVGISNGTFTQLQIITSTSISPSLPISGNTIAVTVGGITSSYITVPYATKAGTLDGMTRNSSSNWSTSGLSMIMGMSDSWGGDCLWLTNKTGLMSFEVDGCFYQRRDSGGSFRVVDVHDLESYYTKSVSDGRYVYKSGDTMTGTLTMSNCMIWVQSASAAGNSSNRMGLSAGMPSGMPYNTSKRGLLLYANAIAICDPYNGNSNNDSCWIRHLEETANTGYMEIAVGDDGGNEYIYFRGYNTSSTVQWLGYIAPGADMYMRNFYTTSDRSKKQNISSFSEHIRKFQLKDTEKWHYGVIAQEVPEMFRGGEEGNMTVNYNSVLSYYIGELENKVKMLEDEIKELKNKLK